jgi:peptide-methionine (S)-S-oxide reductase
MKNFLLAALLTALTLAGPSARAATAILAGGCFWCMEADFEKLEGVSDVVSGFTGGTHPDPSYNGAHTGHYEAVRITYDPEVIDYQGILDHFWVNHDPFDARGQFCDKGHEYLAAIFVAVTVVTPILPRATFYPIEGDEVYHQDYYKKSPLRYKYYRFGCGRDSRLEEIWGDRASRQ